MHIDATLDSVRKPACSRALIIAGILIAATISASARGARADAGGCTVHFASGRAVYDGGDGTDPNWKYVAVYTEFTIAGAKGRDLQLVAFAADANQKCLKYDDGNWLLVCRNLTPGFDLAYYDDDKFAAAFNVDNLHHALGAGVHHWVFLVNVWDPQTRAWLMPASYVIDYTERAAESADRPERPSPNAVWVDAVYQTVEYAIWFPPKFGNVTENIWHEPEYGTWLERRSIPDHYNHDGTTTHGGVIDVKHRILKKSGYSERVTHWGVIRDGHYETPERKRVATPGHWEVPAPTQDKQ